MDNSFYRVRRTAVAAVANCVVRVCSALALFVLLGMCLGYLGAFRCVFILVMSLSTQVSSWIQSYARPMKALCLPWEEPEDKSKDL